MVCITGYRPSSDPARHLRSTQHPVRSTQHPAPESVDLPVLDADDLERFVAARRLDDHRVAVAGLDQGFGERGYPGDAAAREVGFVYADDAVGLFRAVA